MSHELQHLSSQEVAEIHREHAVALERFLVGVLRDATLAADCLQATFTKLVQQGHKTKPESRRSWLFTVAYQEAMLAKRKESTTRRVLAKGVMEKAVWTLQQEPPSAEEAAMLGETVERMQAALVKLPEAQRQLVRMRIYEEKTFAVIAQELHIPLGTALARMRSALQKLREALSE